MPSRYDHLSREELVGLLEKRDAARRLGLVWERDELEHDRTINEEFVAHSLDESLSSGEAPYQNLVIEGDNFDALRYLQIAYRGRVKCICIDPPYNTGNKDFIYNDKSLEKDDAWRHSKWLEFLYRRLLLARDLLADDGVVLVCIGDDSRALLDLLMEKVFPGMRVGSLVWRKRGQTNASSVEHFFSSDHEHVLVYARPGFAFRGSQKTWSGYTNWDEDRQDWWASDNLTLGFNRDQRPNLYYPLFNPATDVWYPCDPQRVWVYASKERLKGREVRTQPMEDMISDRRVHFPEEGGPTVYDSVASLRTAVETGAAPPFLEYEEDLAFWVGKRIGRGKPRYKRYTKDLQSTEQPLSSWIQRLLAGGESKEEEEDPADSFAVASGYTAEGTKVLRQLGLGGTFNYPKPLSLITNLVAQAAGPDGLVLDFFAGSGTTAQAVLALNAEDQGSRRFILVSSTEATAKEPGKNVCRDVCAVRVRRAIEGYGKGKPLPGSFAYLKAQRIPMANVHLDATHEQVWYALQQLHGAGLSPFLGGEAFQVLLGADLRVFYLPSATPDAIERLRRAVGASPKQAIVYSWQPGALSRLPPADHVSLEKIPEFLLGRFGKAVP